LQNGAVKILTVLIDCACNDVDQIGKAIHFSKEVGSKILTVGPTVKILLPTSLLKYIALAI